MPFKKFTIFEEKKPGFIFNFQFTNQKQSGFTLVELLVVITIIAILSSIGFSVYNNAQKSAKDAKRRGDVDSIAKALEVEYELGNSTPYPPLRPDMFQDRVEPKDPSSGNVYTGVPRSTSVPNFVICADMEIKGNSINYAGDPPADEDEVPTKYCKRNAR